MVIALDILVLSHSARGPQQLLLLIFFYISSFLSVNVFLQLIQVIISGPDQIRIYFEIVLWAMVQ